MLCSDHFEFLIDVVWQWTRSTFEKFMTITYNFTILFRFYCCRTVFLFLSVRWSSIRWYAGHSVSFWEKLMRRPAHHGGATSSRFYGVQWKGYFSRIHRGKADCVVVWSESRKKIFIFSLSHTKETTTACSHATPLIYTRLESPVTAGEREGWTRRERPVPSGQKTVYLRETRPVERSFDGKTKP